MGVVVGTNDEGIPQLRFPEPFNAATYCIDRHVAEGRGNKAAIRTLEREITYAEALDSVNRFGNALRDLGIRPGDRVLMVAKDCPEFFFLFWGAIKIGAMPVPLNGLAPASDFDSLSAIRNVPGCFIHGFKPTIENALAACSLKPKVVLPIDGDGKSLNDLARNASPKLESFCESRGRLLLPLFFRYHRLAERRDPRARRYRRHQRVLHD